MNGDFWFGAGKEERSILSLTARYTKRKRDENKKGCHIAPILCQASWDSRGREKLGQKEKEAFVKRT